MKTCPKLFLSLPDRIWVFHFVLFFCKGHCRNKIITILLQSEDMTMRTCFLSWKQAKYSCLERPRDLCQYWNITSDSVGLGRDCYFFWANATLPYELEKDFDVLGYWACPLHRCHIHTPPRSFLMRFVTLSSLATRCIQLLRRLEKLSLSCFTVSPETSLVENKLLKKLHLLDVVLWKKYYFWHTGRVELWIRFKVSFCFLCYWWHWFQSPTKKISFGGT